MSMRKRILAVLCAVAASALALMEEKKITSLMVVDAKGRLEGIVHLHDLWTTGLV